MSENIVVKLKKPIDHAGETISEVSLRAEMTVSDLEHMDAAKGQVGKSVHLIAHLSGLSLSAVRKLDVQDYLAVDKTVQEIMGEDPTQPTGGT
jgi:hypothetical protein